MKKNIVLVGGSKGIGKSIALQLQESHTVYILSRTDPGLEQVTHIPFDVLQEPFDMPDLPEGIHGLAYCPGSITLKPLKSLDLNAYISDMQINFFGLVKVVRALREKMAPGSNMVFFSTVAVGRGMPYHSSIAAAKGAVEGFSRSLAAELAPHIRVNVIAPSLVDTQLASRLLGSEEKRNKMGDRHPLRRVGRPEDISDLAAYLLTREDGWVTGQVFGVDGGISSLNVN